MTKKRDTKYKAEAHEGENISLRIPIDYRRAGLLDDIYLSYMIIKSKGREKSRYIATCIDAENYRPKTLTIPEELAYEARKMECISLLYNLRRKEDFEAFFEKGDKIEAIRKKLEPYAKEPAKMTLGFNKEETSKKVYDFLGELAPRERVTVIAKSVLNFTKKGKDADGLALLANRALLEMYEAYHVLKGEDRANFLDHIDIFAEQSRKFCFEIKEDDEKKESEEVNEEEKKSREVTEEIRKYFM